MTDSVIKIAIIGAGITGLSAAFYAKKFLKAKNLKYKITLIEKSNSLGGKIQTLYRDGMILERVPDSFLARKTQIINLAKELGMEKELVATGPYAKKTYILLKAKLKRIPKGFKLGIPTEIMPFVKTDIISLKAKLRAALELFIPRRKESEDESIGSFFERRFGREIVENVVEPLLSGIYAGDLYKLSIKATFPNFHEDEKKHRSLILSMLKTKKNTTILQNLPKIAQDNVFLTFKNGLGSLILKLEESLNDVEILKETCVTKIEKLNENYKIYLNNSENFEADGVILALPNFESEKILKDVNFPKIRTVSVANVILVYNKNEINHPLDSSGFVVAKNENRTITACTFTSSKWPHTAPYDKVIIRCYVGRDGDEEKVFLDDKELVGLVKNDIFEILGINAKPLFYEINRIKNASPQYEVGHMYKLSNFKKELSYEYPGVYLTGSSYYGVGIPDCIKQGKETFQELAEFLQNKFKVSEDKL